MIISFFEEFPTQENLEKIDLINFETKLYVAANSLEEFKEIKKKIKSSYVKEIIYWPILKFNEGYWLSPFSDKKAIKRVIGEAKKINIMWDAEWPKKRSLILTNFYNFFSNKKMILKFFNKHKNEIYTSEYFPEKGLLYKFLEFFGLSFNPKVYGNKVIKMVYSSMHNYSVDFVKKEIKCGVENFGNNFIVALGTIAKGINGDEPILSLKIFERDLKICKKAGVSEVVIFRLGGLNKDYLKLLQKFI